MGLQGHSFGGYQTQYIIAHSKLFAAAMSSSGWADLIGRYGSILLRGVSGHYTTEVDRSRIGATLWERPDLYIKNSAIFSADKITTPLLMMNNKRDDQVPFPLGVELFTALQRLGKKAWMLQYDEGEHMVYGKGAIDLTIRVNQFFDHYLKGAPAPKWMVEGIPAYMKGFETGFELMPGREP
jgi:dipeptidyl aminopeptidase/acylaminoacyl peptidase